MPARDAERVVIDANAAVNAVLVQDAFAGWEKVRIYAPSLIWSEVTSALSQMRWRGEITAEQAGAAVSRLLAAPIEPVDSRDLLNDALALAHKLGWAKTYDAEYVVLARRLTARFVTLDARLAAAVVGHVDVISPQQIALELESS